MIGDRIGGTVTTVHWTRQLPALEGYLLITGVGAVDRIANLRSIDVWTAMLSPGRRLARSY